MNFLPEFLALLQIMLIDLSMAGDNALVVGMAAAGLPKDKRHQAVIAGIAGATVLRIVFAIFAVQILHITGLLAAGGLLLLWVSWKMYQELRQAHSNSSKQTESSPSRDREGVGEGVEFAAIRKSQDSTASLPSPPSIPSVSGREAQKTLSSAIWQIIVADVSMSLDNVLGVAGVARDHIGIMAIGLVFSVVLMGVASTFVARLVARHHWVGYVGLAVILYAAVKMIVDGAKPFLPL